MGSSNGTTIVGQANGVSDSSPNELNNPSSVLVDYDGNIYIGDRLNNRVQFWTNDALVGKNIAGNATGVPGNTNNLLNTPYGIARDPSTGILYITGTINYRIMSYSSGDSSGNVVADGNGAGSNNSQLCRPAVLYFDTLSNSLIIANFGCNNMIRWVWALVVGLC